MHRNSLKIVAIFLLVILSSWGFLVHRTITQTAIYSLPDSMQVFYYKNSKELVKASVEPDVRQRTDSTEKTKHFIDLDSPLFKGKPIPDKWEMAVKKYGEKKLRIEGTLPWEIIKTKKKLSQAFISKDKTLIVLYSADLAHYVADAFVPLHTTMNYDGQLTNQVGLHSLWETECPQFFLENYNLNQNTQLRYLKNMDKEIWQILRESEKLVKTVIEVEKSCSNDFDPNLKYRFQTRNGIEERKYSAQFIKAYNEKMASQINTRLLKSSEMIANFWYTAWVDAKKPNLNGLVDFSDEDLNNLKEEKEAWKANLLIEKKLLRAKNGNN
ncbi:MAG: zinc dependent phospholipase C family protein [Bacteroidota bacterium]